MQLLTFSVFTGAGNLVLLPGAQLFWSSGSQIQGAGTLVVQQGASVQLTLTSLTVLGRPVSLAGSFWVLSTQGQNRSSWKSSPRSRSIGYSKWKYQCPLRFSARALCAK